jgi:catechol 2,3-dioxygenase-like lactoylglutathione lyase family enzyme
MLQHVALEIGPDVVDECVAFWALLGFERAEKPPRLQTSSTWVQREGTQIHLVPEDEPVVARKGHVAVVAPDYERVVLALSEAGHAVREAEDVWDAPRCTVRDPAGHTIEIMSAPPP